MSPDVFSFLPPPPPTPRQVIYKGFPEFANVEDFGLTPQDLLPKKEDAIKDFKSFAVESLPNPKAVAAIGREMTESTVMDKVKFVAVVATPPAIIIGAIIAGCLVLMGGGMAGAGAGAGGAGAGAGGAGGALVPTPFGG